MIGDVAVMFAFVYKQIHDADKVSICTLCFNHNVIVGLTKGL